MHLGRMLFQMSGQISSVFEAFITTIICTLVFFIRVHSLMCFQLTCIGKSFSTFGAYLSGTTVTFDVMSIGDFIVKSLVTQFAV